MSLGLNGSSAGAGGSNSVVGTYTGTGSSITLTFDAPVKAFIVNGLFKGGSGGLSEYTGTGIWINGRGHKFASLSTNYGSFQMSGFSPTVSENSITIPSFVVSGSTYNYIAFF